MIKVTLTRKSDSVVALDYIGDGNLFDVHHGAEQRVQELMGLEEKDKVLVRTVETKTGNSINTAVAFGSPCSF